MEEANESKKANYEDLVEECSCQGEMPGAIPWERDVSALQADFSAQYLGMVEGMKTKATRSSTEAHPLDGYGSNGVSCGVLLGYNPGSTLAGWPG